LNITPLLDSNPLSLAERYRLGDTEVCELFGMHPSQDANWVQRAVQLDESVSRRADLQQVMTVLKSYQAKLPYYSEAAASLEKLGQAGCLVVAGGQQAGLFGGAMLI
jgi:uncharacterized protein YllA (UPF0747 family)